jgi:hypothetical protein
MNETNTLNDILSEWKEDSSTYTVDFSGPHSNVSLSSPYTISSGINFPNAVYTASTVSSPWATSTNITGAQIHLEGEGADIDINGKSLMATLQALEERLNVLVPNTKLEAEWEELKVLGNRYRELEQHIKDKQATWDRLKAMPPPVID